MRQVYLLLVFPVCLLLIACEEQGGTDSQVHKALIEQGVQIRLADFRQSEWQKCHDQALQLAIASADSIIRALAKQEAVEPIIKPPKPDRPDKPPVRILPDSIVQKATQRPDTVPEHQ